MTRHAHIGDVLALGCILVAATAVYAICALALAVDLSWWSLAALAAAAVAAFAGYQIIIFAAALGEGL